MKNAKTKLTGIILLFSMLLTACGNQSSDVSSDTSDGRDSTTTAPSEDVASYPYEISEMGGELRILNCIDDWWAGMNQVMDYTEETGDMVENAIYNRNRKVEEDLGITIKVIKGEYTELTSIMRQAVSANEDIYDICYLPILWANVTTITNDGYHINLYDIPELHLEEDWWNQSFIDSLTIGTGNDKRLYAASDYANLCGYSYVGMLFFNKTMMESLGLDMPYNAVKDGTWTYDMLFGDYAKYAVNLNGASSFAADPNSTAIYGLGVQHEEGPRAFITGSGSFAVEKGGDGIPKMNSSLDRLSGVFEKLLGYFSQEGLAIMVNQSNTYSAKTLFLADQEMFYYSSLGLSLNGDFRDMQSEYGMLPIPKYDEDQDQYYSSISQYTLAVNIPQTVTDTKRVGKILDYMEYVSYTELMPVFYEALCYKGIRDEDSIEMLEIIDKTQTVDIGFLYGVTNSMMNSLATNLCKGDNIFASTVDSQRNIITAALEKLLTDDLT